MSLEQSNNTKRVAKNTLLLYGRMFFAMLVTLYTSRVVLSTLGVEDYGIYIAVGGVVSMFSFFSISLSSAVSRFLTFELAKGSREQLSRIFSTSFVIHVVLAVVVLLVAETIGLWFLNEKMNIPVGRIQASNWVFQCAVFSLLLGIVNVPYNASIISHERMKAFAYMGILDITLKLFVVLLLAHTSWGTDKLVMYSILYAIVGLLLQTIYVVYCKKHFVECCVKLRLDKNISKQILSFAGWNLMGTTAVLLKDQGLNVLLNVFCGTVVNAARGLSYSVNAAVSSFTGNFMIALNPQITKSYASGERAYTMSLVQRGSRFSFYILLILALPILFETEFILKLWLNNYPIHTANFVRLILVLSMCDVLSNTLITLQLATGKIRDYQLAVGGLYLMNFPLSYLFLKMGYMPEVTMMVAIVISLCCLLLRLFFLKKMVQFSIKEYLTRVLGNALLITICALILPCFIYCCFSAGVMRFVLICMVGMIGTSGIVFLLGCTRREREFVCQRGVGLFNNLKNKRNTTYMQMNK
jgi:O-antigen/teichoic acid export membrane protein